MEQQRNEISQQLIFSIKPYIALLGLTKEINFNTIGLEELKTAVKKKYHKLSLQYHPDKCTLDDATKHFQEIFSAYSAASSLLENITSANTPYDSDMPDYAKSNQAAATVVGSNSISFQGGDQEPMTIAINDPMKNALYAYYEKRHDRTEGRGDHVVQAMLRGIFEQSGFYSIDVTFPDKRHTGYLIKAPKGTAIAIRDFLTSIQDYEWSKIIKDGYTCTITSQEAGQIYQALGKTTDTNYSSVEKCNFITCGFSQIIHSRGTKRSTAGLHTQPSGKGQGYTVYIAKGLKSKVENMLESDKILTINRQNCKLESKKLTPAKEHPAIKDALNQLTENLNTLLKEKESNASITFFNNHLANNIPLAIEALKTGDDTKLDTLYKELEKPRGFFPTEDKSATGMEAVAMIKETRETLYLAVVEQLEEKHNNDNQLK